MLSLTVGAILRKARMAQGVSRAELAAKAGVSVRLVAELERGARPNVSLETALQLLCVVGVALVPRADADANGSHPPSSGDAATGSAATEQRERAERSAARRATWVGSISTLAAVHPPRPPASIAARLAAVSHASALVYALSRGVQSATQTTITDGASATASSRKRGKSVAPASSR